MSVQRMISHIFYYPSMAALIVGGMIHLFNHVNASISGYDYYAYLVEALSHHPLYGGSKILIPFLVPLLVTTIGKRLSQRRQKELMQEFPEMNPDLVFKLDQHGTILYTNPAVHQQLRHFGLSKEQAERVLPGNFRQQVAAVFGKDEVCLVAHNVKGVEFEYRFRGRTVGDSVFVSGHDVTALKHLQHRLKAAQQRIDTMTDFLEQTFADYGQDGFDLEHAQHGVLKALMTPGDTVDIPPTHVFLAQIKEKQVRGFLYMYANQQVQRLEPEIIIDPTRDQYAILEGINKLTWTNWEDETGTIQAFQSRFHPQVQAHCGMIERFSAYNSGRIAMIAFYKGRLLTEIDAKVLKELVVFASGLHRISHERQETENAFIYTVDSLARASEANDEDTGDHIVRINEYSCAIAQQMGLADEFVRTIHYSAQMHDVGKIQIPTTILKKPGRLNAEEVEKMQKHPLYGAMILGNSPRLAMAAEIAIAHHEKYNGKGYPRGLVGEAIPLSARIVAITDVYDALRQKRVYKPAFSHQKTMEIICQGDGRTDPSEFDPKVLQAFQEIHEEMATIFDRFQRPS